MEALLLLWSVILKSEEQWKVVNDAKIVNEDFVVNKEIVVIKDFYVILLPVRRRGVVNEENVVNEDLKGKKENVDCDTDIASNLKVAWREPPLTNRYIV